MTRATRPRGQVKRRKVYAIWHAIRNCYRAPSHHSQATASFHTQPHASQAAACQDMGEGHASLSPAMPQVPVSILEVGSSQPFDGYLLQDFFAGFSDLSRRPRPPHLPSRIKVEEDRGAGGKKKTTESLCPPSRSGESTSLLRLRDWPAEASFQHELHDHFADLMAALPLASYTTRYRAESNRTFRPSSKRKTAEPLSNRHVWQRRRA